MGTILVRVIAAVLGLLLALGGLLSIYYLATLVETEAEVVSVEHRQAPDGSGDEWFPTLSFKGADGRVHRYRMPVVEGEGLAAPVAVGERIDIRYDPRNPERVRLSVTWGFYLLPILFFLLGWLLLAGAVGFRWGTIAN